MNALTRNNLGIGLVGSGFIGLAHIEGLRTNGLNLLAIAESSLEKAQEKAAQFGVPRAYGSIDDLLADPDIHIVHLATPNVLHFPHARAVLLAGKHVICEKPLAMNVVESAELVRLASETGLVNAVNFNIRMYPLMHHARHMVQSGELGRPFIVQGSYLQDWLLYDTDWNWRLEPEQGGNLRVVADTGSHWLDLITFITGQRVSEVYADLKIIHETRKKPLQSVETYTGKALEPGDYAEQPVLTEDYGTILLHYENGMTGVMTVAQVCAGRKNRLYFEISASQSSISWDSEQPNELWIGNRGKPNQILLKDQAVMSPDAQELAMYPAGHAEGFPDTFKNFSRKVYDYLLAGDFSRQPDFPTFKDGHYEMQLCAAIERSAKTRGWVTVE